MHTQQYLFHVDNFNIRVDWDIIKYKVKNIVHYVQAVIDSC